MGWMKPGIGMMEDDGRMNAARKEEFTRDDPDWRN
jgi:hypothetical protein